MGQNFVLHVLGQWIELRLKFVAYLNVPLLRHLIMSLNAYVVQYIFGVL